MRESNFSFPLRQQQVNLSVCVCVCESEAVTAGESVLQRRLALLMECCQMFVEGQRPE